MIYHFLVHVRACFAIAIATARVRPALLWSALVCSAGRIKKARHHELAPTRMIELRKDWIPGENPTSELPSNLILCLVRYHRLYSCKLCLPRCRVLSYRCHFSAQQNAPFRTTPDRRHNIRNNPKTDLQMLSKLLVKFNTSSSDQGIVNKRHFSVRLYICTMNDPYS